MPRRIVFIDPSIPDFDTLWTGRSPTAETVVLDPSRHPSRQIIEAIAERSNSPAWEAIHIVAHGMPGGIQLGTDTVDADDLTDPDGPWAHIGRMPGHGNLDLCLWTCETAQGPAGQRFIDTLRKTTGARVSASTRPVGSARQGGCWSLDIGPESMMPPAPPFSAQALAAYSGLLGTPTVTATNVLIDSTNGPDGARQEEAAITALSNGGHVVTYTSNANGGGLYQVRYKVYDAAGTVLVSDLVYNNTGQGKHDWTSSVTAIDGGRFVVAYFHGGDVYARIFNNNGIPAGNAFLLSTSSTGSEYSPSITGLQNGGFMAVWNDDGQIVGRVFSSTGSPGAEFQVNSTAGSSLSMPMSAASGNGGWVTVWTSITGTTSEIKARLYDAAGNGSQELTLATAPVPANNTNPASVAVLTNGDFVVTWTQGTAVVGAVYSATGTPRSTFTTEAIGTTQTARPDVIALADGGFLLAWNTLAAGDWNVKAQRFTSDGTKDGSEIQVNTASTATEVIGSETGHHSLAQLASGQVVVTFLGTAGGSNDVYSRTLDLGVASNHAPTITSGAAVTVAENTTAVMSVVATDADGQALTYSITGGADAARFVINSTTGALAFASAPNYEAPTDSGANNVYDVTVRVSDGQGGTDEQAIAVTVTNVNESPVLDARKSPVLTTITEDATAPVNGSLAGATRVADLVNSGALGNFSDVDGNPAGLAITGVSTAGTLYYSTNAGAAWSAVGSVSSSSARVFQADANTYLYFKPNANYTGDLADALTFKAWDGTGGYANGQNGVDASGGLKLGSAGLVGVNGPAAELVVNGQYAYVAAFRFKVVDVSNPAAPSVVSSLTFPGEDVVSVAFRDHYAYVTCGSGGLRVIDVSNPANPSVVGQWDTPGSSGDVALRGNYAYVADSGKVSIIDISVPSNPTFITTFELPRLPNNNLPNVMRVEMQGNYAYLGADGDGLYIVDLTNPVAPVTLGQYGFAGGYGTTRLAVQGDYAYGVSGFSELLVIDVRDPAHPQKISTIGASGAYVEMGVSGNYLFGTYRSATDRVGGIDVWDLSDPANPQKVGSYFTGTLAFDITFAGGKAYLANYWAGTVQILSITPGSSSFSVASDTAALTVTGVDDAPTLTGTPATLASGTEDTPYLIREVDMLAGWTDADGDTVSVVNLACTQGSISDNGNGTWTFTPSANFSGQVQLTYEVSDGQGFATATSRTFTLSAVNDAPVLTGNAAQLAAGTEDVAYTVKDSDLLAGWSDVEGASLSVTGVSADHGSVTRNADGSTWKFTPTANYAGTVVFSYTVQDGTGGSTAATLNLSLAPVNDAPTLVGALASLPAGLQDHAYTLHVADLVQGYGDVDGDPLTIVGLTATHGSVTNQGDGIWLYTPDRGYTGSVSLTYQVIDGQGGSTLATQSLRLDVDDGAPRLTGTAATLADGQEDTPCTLSEQDLLAGWSDAESAVLNVTNLQASHGQLSARHANGTWTFTPDADFNGTVVLSYRVEDGNGSSSPASLLLAIDPVNDNPTLTGAPVTLTPVQEDTAITLRATDLLRGYTDVDAGDTLDVSDLSISNGTLAASGPGTWRYTPDANFNGTARVRYNVVDSEGGRAAVALDLVITAVNDTPVLLKAMADQEAAQDSVFSALLPEDMFSDVENGDALTLVARLASGAALPAWLSFDATTGRFAGTPSAADIGVLQIVVTATDSGGLGVSDTFALTVQAPRTVTGTSGNDTLTGNSASERFVALAGNDIVTAGAGNDTLDGGAGSDTLTGGLGNDTYVVDSSTDVVTELAGEGTDTVQASLSLTLGAEVENLVLTGTGNLSGRGNALDNTLTGNSGANTLDGAAGADTMAGGGGNDTYVVDNAADTVVEGISLGSADLVLASVNHTLTANVENLTLTGTATEGAGNELANVLTGNGLDNLLDGQAGADRMVGGQGNDRYVVDHLGDLVVEAAGEGMDTVLARISGYTLAAQVEQLVLQGLATTGTGNADDNTLTANVYDSRLAGDAGNDRLIGLGGHDTLDGGSGIDTMTGGAGNDTYVVDNSADVILENTAQGVLDTVLASVSYTLGAQIELLTLTGTGALNATGNDLANVLTGNSGNNVLDGQAGVDTLIGGAGNDLYIVDSIDDVVTEAVGQGTDTVQASVDFTLASNVENLTLTGTARTGVGNTGANVLIGNALDNLLDGQEGADRMAGGQGNDSYRVDNLADVVVELAGEGTDTVYALVSGYTLGTGVENLTLQGKAVSATGNAGNNVITGNKLASLLAGGAGDDQLTGQSGDDTLDGGTGNDTLTGGGGNDLYRVDSGSDRIVEQSGQGVDLVQASVSYTLAAEVENLVLTGTAAIDATGNTAGNALTGNSGDNVLDGGAGADTLSGGRGNDTYRVDQAGDTVIEALSQGTDTVVSTISWTLGANLENLNLSGTAVRGIGNTDKNVIVGSAGANVLAGGLGLDTLTGGAGNDVFLFDTTPNRLTNVDTITDFTVGADRIVLDVRVFKGLSVPAGQSEAALAAGALRVGAGLSTAGDADDRLIFNTSTGALYYDADGRNGLASVQIATLTGVSALDASAFGLTSVDASTLWVG